MNSVGLGVESVPVDEAEHIGEILALFRSIQEHKDRKATPVPRSVHPKQHGCVLAEFAVESGLPAGVAHGVFREPRVYAALVRFSNSKQRDDRLPDGHGMAVKLLDVSGEQLLPERSHTTTQDFVLIDHPVFFAKDVADMVPLMRDFERLMVGGIVAKARTVLKGMFSRDHRFRLLRAAGAKRPDNPLEIQYWSTTPYQLGAGAMKFSLRPELHYLPARSDKSSDKLRHAMAASLRSRDAIFDFLVQIQMDPQSMPIEDATRRWDEHLSPFIKAATLKIPAQAFDSAAQLEFGEKLSFNPWHGINAHRPLGGINRARKQLYEVMSSRRLELNGSVSREPTLSEAQALFPRRVP
jgi:hypothetical protein